MSTARSRYEIRVASGSIELVDLTDLEVVLFWDCRPKERRRMVEAMRYELDRLDADEFVHRWALVEPADFA
jgi:hypothetical protein